MKQQLKKQDTEFTQIKNSVLEDKNLSWKAKGIYCYIYSKPDKWDFSVHRIKEDSVNGIKPVLSALKELEENNYLYRNKLSNGRVIYYINYNKKPRAQKGYEGIKKPRAQNGNEPKRQRAKKGTISNTNIKVIKKNNNKEEKLIKKTEKFIDKVRKEFKGITINKSQVEELKKFVSYWTEPNKSKTKLRWEMQPTWDMKRRIGTWMRNNDDWGNNNNKTKSITL